MHGTLPQELMSDNSERNFVALKKKENSWFAILSTILLFKGPKMSKRNSSSIPLIVGKVIEPAAKVIVPAAISKPLLTDKELTCDRAIAESLAETGPMDMDLLRRGKSLFT